jgi:hypothetical protein
MPRGFGGRCKSQVLARERPSLGKGMLLDGNHGLRNEFASNRPNEVENDWIQRTLNSFDLKKKASFANAGMQPSKAVRCDDCMHLPS